MNKKGNEREKDDREGEKKIGKKRKAERYKKIKKI